MDIYHCHIQYKVARKRINLVYTLTGCIFGDKLTKLSFSVEFLKFFKEIQIK